MPSFGALRKWAAIRARSRLRLRRRTHLAELNALRVAERWHLELKRVLNTIANPPDEHQIEPNIETT